MSENDKYWKELFEDLDSMSAEEFSKTLDKLDESPDIPFCIADSSEPEFDKDRSKEDSSDKGDVTKNE